MVGGIITSCQAAWHPSGDSIVYSQSRGSNVNLRWHHFEGEDVQITDHPLRGYDAIWIDDSRLFFVREQTKGESDYQLYFLDTEDGEPLRITENVGGI